VAKGFNQDAGGDFNETFYPITIRLVITLALTNKWELFQLDVNKVIYGLKQAPRQWFHRLQENLLQLGFPASKCDPSLFVYNANKHTVYILVYVVGIIIIGSSISLVQQLISQLHSNFSIKQLGKLDYFLGIEIKPMLDGSLLLTQSKDIRDLLKTTKMHQAQFVSSPMTAHCKHTKDDSNDFHDPSFYRSVLSALQYVTVTRPELSYVVNKVSVLLWIFTCWQLSISWDT